MGRKIGENTEGRLGQMGKLAGKKGRREENEKKKKKGDIFIFNCKNNKKNQKRRIFVQDGGLSPSPPPSDLTAPKAKPMKMETEMIARAIKLIWVGWDGEGGRGRRPPPLETCILFSI